MARGFLRRMADERGEPRADRLRIDLAHQPADVLQLAAFSLVGGDALRFAHRGGEIFRQAEFRELRVGERHQLDAERLQRVHFLLALRLADRR